MTNTEKYHVALSFAGEDRAYVEEVAGCLSQAGVKVFYDKFEETKLWGKDLYTYLSDVYQNQAMYTVLFVSKAYGEKLWANHERQSAQARAFTENREYILPAVFDETIEIPGLLKTTGYIKLEGVSASNLAEKIVQKLTDDGVLLQGGTSFQYAQWAKEDVDYSVSGDGEVPAIIRDLKSYNWYTQNPAIERLIALDWPKQTPDEIFILGRNLYQCAVGGERKAVALLGDLRRTLAAMPEHAALHLLNGMFYELYFDSKGVFRGTNLKRRCMPQLFAIQGVEKFAPSVEFIREALGPYRDTLSVLPSTRPEVIVAEVSIDGKDPPFYNECTVLGE